MRTTRDCYFDLHAVTNYGTRMKRLLIALLALVAPLAPAQAYWEYGHETVAHIAQANMSPKARANMQRLLRAAPMLGTPKCAMQHC